MIEAFVFEHGKIFKKRFSQLVSRKPGSCVWIDVHKTNKGELKNVSSYFEIHQLVTNDFLDNKVSVKLDEHKNYSHLIIKSINNKFKEEVFNFVLGKGVLISVHKEDSFSKLKRNPDVLKQVMKKGADFLLYYLIDMEVQKFVPVLETIGDEIDKLENSILKGKDPNAVHKIFTLRRKLMKLRNIISPQVSVTGSFSKVSHFFIKEYTQGYFKDVRDDVIWMHDGVSNYRDILSSLVEVHFAINSNKMNEVMKVLTVIATIMLPLTLITGIYGMNFTNMPELRFEYGYFLVLGFMFLLGVLMLLYFRIKKWV